MHFDRTTDQITNSKGIKTIVPGFGGTREIEHLDSSSWFPIVKYYKPLVDFLVKHGYTRGLNIRGAPYDFRFAPGTGDNEIKVHDIIQQTI